MKGYAYVLRTESNADLIAEIEGGIKKENQHRLRVARILAPSAARIWRLQMQPHPGKNYGGKLCYAELVGAVDAYEWSFVAVPAQRNAGVMKKFALHGGLKGFVESDEGRYFYAEYRS